MGMDVATLNKKLNSKAVWTMREIEKTCDLLNISNDGVIEYFFY